MRFEWDPKKAAANRRKHGVTFGQATLVFADPHAAIFDDPDHSALERREIIIGMSHRLLVFVCFTERHEIIRIISARRATLKERHCHEENR